MYRKSRYPKWAQAACTSGLLAVSFMILATRTCDAFPVDFILTAPGEAKQPEPEVQVAKEAPVEVKEAADPKPAAGKAKPVKRGIVREKAAVVAVGAAEAAEEVGQVLGDLIGGLFGRGNRGEPAIAEKLNGNALKQFEAQFGRHFDQMVKTELHFIRVVCQLTREQYDAMAADGKLIRTKTIGKFALLQQGINRGIRSNDSDTRKPISDGLLLSAKRHLSADQVAAYERELTARQEAAKEVAILVTAGKLDRRLVLDTSQRAQVTKVLTDNWNPAWGAPQMMMHGGQHFPDIPDSKITPILTATQKKVLKSATQQSNVFWGFNIGMNQGIAIVDEKWDDESGNEASEETDEANKKVNGEKSEGDDTVEAADAKAASSMPEGSK